MTAEETEVSPCVEDPVEPYVRRLVRDAPRLSEEQRNQLRALRVHAAWSRGGTRAG